MDVNLERAEDVVTHERLLHLARDPANRPAFEVRLVQVSCRCAQFLCVFCASYPSFWVVFDLIILFLTHENSNLITLWPGFEIESYFRKTCTR